jgi:hypothetical protein
MITRAFTRLTAVSVAIAGLAGCAQLNRLGNNEHWDESAEQVARVDVHSSFPALSRATFERVNLLELIDPKRQSGRPEKIENPGKEYTEVFAWFRDTQDKTPEEKKAIRNSVQDQIIAVATSRCNVFKTYLRREQSDTNFLFGTLTTVTGVLGAIVPGARDARNLAGAAGLFSGIEAEYNQAYYSNLAAHVIISGIELRQSQLRESLYPGARDRSITEYTLGSAITDALVFDGSCSTLTGLIMAQDSIQQVTNPGPKAAMNAMLYARTLRAIQDTPHEDLTPEKVRALNDLTQFNQNPLITTLARQNAPASPGTQLQEAAAQANQIVMTVQGQVAVETAQLESSLKKSVKDKDKEKEKIAALVTDYKDWAAGSVINALKNNPVTPCLVGQLQSRTAAAVSAASTFSLASPESANYLELDLAMRRTRIEADNSIAKINTAQTAARKTLEQARALWTGVWADYLKDSSTDPIKALHNKRPTLNLTSLTCP